MKAQDHEMSRLGELVGTSGNAGVHEHREPREGPRLAAKAVLQFLRSRQHTLTLPPATGTTYEPTDRTR